MGKGDRRTRKGKIWRGTNGKSRPKFKIEYKAVVSSKKQKPAKKIIIEAEALPA